MNTKNGEPEFTPENVDEIIRDAFGVSAEEFVSLAFADRVALMLSSGGAYACTKNIAPKDQDGNPVTEGCETSSTRH